MKLLSFLSDFALGILFLPVWWLRRAHERRVLFDEWKPATDCSEEDVPVLKRKIRQDA